MTRRARSIRLFWSTRKAPYRRFMASSKSVSSTDFSVRSTRIAAATIFIPTRPSSVAIARLSCRLVFQCPGRNIAAADKPDSVVPLGVLEALADHWLQGRPSADVTVQRDFHPLRGACFPFRIELIERVLESFPDN